MRATEPYESTATLAAVSARLRAARSVTITTHTKPDGDAIGSAIALARALAAEGRRADVLFSGMIEPPLLPVIGATPYRVIDDAAPEDPGDPGDAIVIVDTGAWSQLEPIADWLRRHRERVIGIDHHAHGDDVAPTRIVDASAAAAVVLVAALLDDLGWAISPGPGGVAEALFVGLATDTGWFRYPNAGPDAFRLGARLLELGVDKSGLYELIEETHRPARLSIEARALASVRFVHGDTVAVQMLRPADFEAAGATPADLTGLVNGPMAVRGVRVSILVSQSQPGRTKVSFRAKPPHDGEPLADVAALAATLGGGGHVFAAGASMPFDLDEATRRLDEALASPSWRSG